MKKKILILITIPFLINIYCKAQDFNIGDDSYYTVKYKLSQKGIEITLADESLITWGITGGDYLFDIQVKNYVILNKVADLELFFINNRLYVIKFDEELISIELSMVTKYRFCWYDIL